MVRKGVGGIILVALLAGLTGCSLRDGDLDAPLVVGVEATTTDPAVLAAQLVEDTVSVTDLLGATVESSGIPGASDVSTVGCASAEGASQVQGTLLLKVFEYEGSATRAYDAIVARWEAAGYSHTDQATGTSIYTATAPVTQLSIRGTADGIEVAALGECRW